MLCLVTQSCPTLWCPMELILKASLPMGILLARILEWVSMISSRGSSQPRDWAQVSYLCCRLILYCLSHQRSPRILEWVAYPFSRGPSQLRNQIRVLVLQVDSLSAELSGKPQLHHMPIYILNRVHIHSADPLSSQFSVLSNCIFNNGKNGNSYYTVSYTKHSVSSVSLVLHF